MRVSTRAVQVSKKHVINVATPSNVPLTSKEETGTCRGLEIPYLVCSAEGNRVPKGEAGPGSALCPFSSKDWVRSEPPWQGSRGGKLSGCQGLHSRQREPGHTLLFFSSFVSDPFPAHPSSTPQPTNPPVAIICL